MDGRPWSPELLDFLAGDFVVERLRRQAADRNDHEVARLRNARRAPRRGEAPSRGYVFAGPEVRRLTAEQFADAIGALTGEWNVYPGRPSTGSGQGPAGGVYAREWRTPSSALTRALGRPIRDQVHSTRAADASTLQALELVNGEMYTRRLARGARRMLGELPPEPVSLYNRAVAGRYAASSPSTSTSRVRPTLWLVVQEAGSNAPEAGAAGVGAGGAGRCRRARRRSRR